MDGLEGRVVGVGEMGEYKGKGRKAGIKGAGIDIDQYHILCFSLSA